MIPKPLLRLAGALVLAALFITNTQASELRTAKQPIEGRYIVVLKEDVATLGHRDQGNQLAQGNSVASVAQSMARLHGARIHNAFSHVLPGFVVEADENALVGLLLDERVAYVEEDGIVSINATQNNATWGLDRIDQRDRPLNGSYIYNTTASNVHIYVIDTGVRGSHSEFSGRMGNGYSAINDGRGWNDCNGHGTHVAGTAAGTAYGVAKGATVHAVRVLGCDGTGPNSGVIAGMDWVAANAQSPAVANMSLGGGASTATDNAVANMRNNGVTVVVAAGNENQNACNVSPARSSAAITVGSTTSSDTRSSFSNYGSCVDIFAPGSSITSAWHTGNSATNTINGTSMASPHVAGIAALYLASNTGASPAQVANAIITNATSGRLSGIGSGSPNLLSYSLFGDGDDGGGGGSIELANGVPQTGLSGSQASERHFTIQIPSGASNLEINMSGGSGDADLYVRRGAPPTTSSYDCRPWQNGNNESCTSNSPQAGTWYIMIRGYSSYSGVSLVGSFDEPGGGSTELANGVPQTGLSGSQASEHHFTIQIPSGASNLEINMSGGSGDADLYVRRGAPPTTSSYDCRPWQNGNNESCTSSSPQAGTWYILIHGYSSYSGVSLVASFDEPGGGGGAPCSNCTHFSGSLTSGSAQIQPNGDYYQAPTGSHQGWLNGPSNADFDLELYRWNGWNWVRVANSASVGSEEHISYSGTASYYYWRVLSYSGSGSYDLWLSTP